MKYTTTSLLFLLTSSSVFGSEVTISYQGEAVQMTLEEGSTTGNIEDFARLQLSGVPESIRLIYDGGQLKEGTLLSDYGIGEQAEIKIYDKPFVSEQGAPNAYIYELFPGKDTTFNEKLNYDHSLFYIVELPESNEKKLYKYDFDTRLNNLIYPTGSEPSGNIFNLFAFEDYIFFHALDDNNQATFFQLEPNSNEIEKIASVDHSSGLSTQRLVGEYQSKLYFSGVDESGKSVVMVFDPATQELTSLESEYAYPGSVSQARYFTINNGKLYFSARVSAWGGSGDYNYREAILSYSNSQRVQIPADKVSQGNIQYQHLTAYLGEIYSVESNLRYSFKSLTCINEDETNNCYQYSPTVAITSYYEPEIFGATESGMYYERENANGYLEVWKMEGQQTSFVALSNYRTLSQPHAPTIYNINSRDYLFTNEGLFDSTNEPELIKPLTLSVIEQVNTDFFIVNEDGLITFNPETRSEEILFSATSERYFTGSDWVTVNNSNYSVAGTFNENGIEFQGSLVILSFGENETPLIQKVENIQVNGNESVDVVFRAMDPEASELVFAIENKPSWAEFNIETGRLWGTPTNDDEGVFTGIVVSVEDEAGQVAYADELSITITSTDTGESDNSDDSLDDDSSSGGAISLMFIASLLSLRRFRTASSS